MKTNPKQFISTLLALSISSALLMPSIACSRGSANQNSVASASSSTAPTPGSSTPASTSPAGSTATNSATSPDEKFSDAELDELFAPIALYPDPLLAQVVPACTFVDQIVDASRILGGKVDEKVIEGQNWDVSVKAVAHYPKVLNMMAEKPDWTTAIGQAYVNQSTDVMTSIQRLRASAKNSGALVTTPQQKVEVEGEAIKIVPAQPQVIYVPEYKPEVVYVNQGPSTGTVVAATAIAFGAGLAIGAWLNRDYNWNGGGVYYHGWSGGGWVGSSRTYVNVHNNVYVNNNFRNVNVNRTVVNRNINSYRTNVHSTVTSNRGLNVNRTATNYNAGARANNNAIGNNGVGNNRVGNNGVGNNRAGNNAVGNNHVGNNGRVNGAGNQQRPAARATTNPASVTGNRAGTNQTRNNAAGRNHATTGNAAANKSRPNHNANTASKHSGNKGAGKTHSGGGGHKPRGGKH